MKRLVLVGCVAIAMLVSACSHGIQIREHAVDYNRAIEGAENEMLLLNIVRSSLGQPMHFTRIINVNGNLNSSVGTSLATSFGAASILRADTSGAIGAASSPSYNVRVLNTQEFYKGFLTPINADIFRLYVSQGWSMDLLVHALVEEARIYIDSDPSKSCKVIGNLNDDEHYSPEKMQMLSDIIKGNGRNFDVFPLPEAIAAPEEFDTIAAFLATNKALSGDLRLVPTDDGKFQLVRPSQNFAFLVTSSGLGQGIRGRANQRLKTSLRFCDLDFLKQITSGSRNPRFAAHVILRSASGMFHAFGEMADLSLTNPAKAKEFKFFAVKKGDVAPPGAISTRHNGVVYWIPADDDGKSSRRFLWLAQEIFSLNISSADDPAQTTFQLR